MFVPPVEAVTSLYMAVRILCKINRETQMLASSFSSSWWDFIKWNKYKYPLRMHITTDKNKFYPLSPRPCFKLWTRPEEREG